MPPSRRPTRARGFDYHDQGPYFVTICAQNKSHLFGTIENGVMSRNDAGDMVDLTWQSLSGKYPFVVLHSHVVMPNHVHGLLWLAESDDFALTATDRQGFPASLSEIVGWFKTMTTNRYIHGVRANSWQRFDGSVWQRSFHDRIVRNEAEFDRCATYIANNPATWERDTFFS